ncbi:hypothetical protein NC653_019184 [Populus alba x Populus x berolinensis]|uniref:Uncharacterized protein n=1 Tax=Populus alba x Populus x berolinensis TaxID=444605 RepID=A0AAD6QIB0_9ROSI|nr:hypothetical protein NC653_019184 [Populus alba x Populus x berolinensis]
MEGSNVNNSNSEVFPSWYQAFSSLSSTELLSAFMPPTSFSAVKRILQVQALHQCCNSHRQRPHQAACKCLLALLINVQIMRIR